MKKWWILLLVVLLLSGCGTAETFETLGDISHLSPTQGLLRQVVLTVPEGATLEVSSGDTGVTMYSCEEYTIVLQSFASGDMTSTIRTLSGFAPEQLTIMESNCADHERYDWVWTAVSEEGELVCRGAVLDDGAHHYALYVMAPSEAAGELQGQWNALFASFCLET